MATMRMAPYRSRLRRATRRSTLMCSELSRRQHSNYEGRPLDLPWRGHGRSKVHSRRWFCDVPACHRQIFAERFDGVLAPLRVVIAVPVARPQTVDSLRREADEVVSVVEPEPFLAVAIHSSLHAIRSSTRSSQMGPSLFKTVC